MWFTIILFSRLDFLCVGFLSHVQKLLVFKDCSPPGSSVGILQDWFLLLLHLLLVSDQKIITKTNVTERSPLFSSEFYFCRPYIQLFNLFWVNFCIWCKIVVQFSFFCMWLSSLSITIFWRDSFPKCIFLVSLS